MFLLELSISWVITDNCKLPNYNLGKFSLQVLRVLVLSTKQLNFNHEPHGHICSSDLLSIRSRLLQTASGLCDSSQLSGDSTHLLLRYGEFVKTPNVSLGL